jgi:hypothetical protein
VLELLESFDKVSSVAESYAEFAMPFCDFFQTDPLRGL